MGESSSSSNNKMPSANEIQVSLPSSSPLDCSGRSPTSIGRTQGGSHSSSVEESIEKSKSHWSKVCEFDCGEEVAEVNNVELFKTLQRHPRWGTFFMSFGEEEKSWGELVMGRKFAEGGQAELYEVQIQWRSERMREQNLKEGAEWVLKVFKKGTFLRHLQSQWPQGMLKFDAIKVNRQKRGLPSLLRMHTDVFGSTLLEDGRFAFLMVKEKEDLRSLINHRQIGPNMGPLSMIETMLAMSQVAYGMKQFHDRGIVHRDLKASNVLVTENGVCLVADFECSVGIMGTGFFRAPEILKASKLRNLNLEGKLFTKAADVYSYGMICYEILTGKLPFEGHPLNDYDLVINGGRPEVPQYVDGWICKLLNRCWHSNPARRPSFKKILNILVANSQVCRDCILEIQEEEQRCRIRKDSKGLWMIVEKFKSLQLKLLTQFMSYARYDFMV